MRSPAALLSIVGAVALAACTSPTDGILGEGETSPPPDTIAEDSVTLVGGPECSNEDAGYMIRYPQAWFANDGDVAPACTLFDREPIVLERQTEVGLDLGVIVGTAPVAFAEYVDTTGGVEVDERTATQLAGRDAVILRGRGTGDALIPASTRVHRYVVDLADGRVLVASTYDTGDLAFARKIEVLDAMMDTLQLDDPGSARS